MRAKPKAEKLQGTAGQTRTVIEAVTPQIDCGRYAIKRVVGERVIVQADVFADGHDELSAVLRYKAEESASWQEAPMSDIGNDRWQGEFIPDSLGIYLYSIEAWVDGFATWLSALRKRIEAGQDVAAELPLGERFVERALARAGASAGEELHELVSLLRTTDSAQALPLLTMLEELAPVIRRYSERLYPGALETPLRVTVDRRKALFSSWYELFPRSTSPVPNRPGTFKDCMEWLPYVASMGFDVLYLAPIHPIGSTHRKGRNNALAAAPGDPGSPWAIGSKEGGHTAIDPGLGTLEDFRNLVAGAKSHGLEIALDIAFQASPDHPYVKEHPEWFRKRSDGSIQYAENPPKKYQDIYPFDFESADWSELWQELTRVFFFWIEQGVLIFRVDNPHTKPFAFWEYCIGAIKARHPEVILLSEAFTRPKVRYNLAKVGFTQSYSYFAWRNTKYELTTYLTELTQTEVREFFRPNFWPNTPDILTEYLQHGGRPAFVCRLLLAATLGSSYGIFGPSFELGENAPRELRSEEYLDSEKYQLRHWNRQAEHSLQPLITQVNTIRREHRALQSNVTLRFHTVDNDQIIAYSKHFGDDAAELLLMVVNLDPFHTHSGWVELPLRELSIDPAAPYQVHDLLTGNRYVWRGARNFVMLNPHHLPAHVFRVRRWLRSETGTDYFQ